ncbi:MAG: hypothetical protein II007_06060 [Gammaproteobacteria bacterium]|nr:hypothetical protein [Gammaproteobacteria bacterium]
MRLAAFAAVLLLAGCATSWTFESNLDPQAISDYFAPGSVVVITAEATGQRPTLGPVSGEACQESTVQVPVTEADARTELRAKAAQMGAEAVVIEQCTTLSGKEAPPSCLTLILCSGHAYGPEPAA